VDWVPFAAAFIAAVAVLDPGMRAADELQQALGRSPTTVELADHLHVTVDEVLKVLGVAVSRREISLDQPLGDDADDCLGDPWPPPDPGRSRRTCSPWPG
jgi:DNA-directed RNA polymerase sigma subunit (sigma70/sigma32)